MQLTGHMVSAISFPEDHWLLTSITQKPLGNLTLIRVDNPHLAAQNPVQKKESDSYLISLQVICFNMSDCQEFFFVQSLVKSQFLSTCLAAPKLHRAIIVHHLWTSTVCSSGLGVWLTTSYDWRNLQISIISAAEMKHVSDAQCTLVFYRLSAGFPYRVSFGLHEYVSSLYPMSTYISSLYPR